MAPVLLLFVMVDFYNLLEQSYETHGIEKIGFATESDESYMKGQIFRHDAKKLYRSTRIKIINGMIYVDDTATALVFASRNKMIKTLPLAQKFSLTLEWKCTSGNA
jgi:hypothetical protein